MSFGRYRQAICTSCMKVSFILNLTFAWLPSYETMPLVALYGLPGVGKTTLAAAITQLQPLHERFPDGLLWAGLGPSPQLIVQLQRWAHQLGIPPEVYAKATTIPALNTLLERHIQGKRMLIIIDDAWNIADALACKVGNARCGYLLTTRSPVIAAEFTQTMYAVPSLNDTDSLSLLAAIAPDVIAAYPQAVRACAEAPGGLPLAIMLIGRYLRITSVTRQPRRMRAAFMHIRDATARLHLSVPLAPNELPPTHAPTFQLSLASTLAMSVGTLTETGQHIFRCLGALPHIPYSFAEETVQAIADVSVDATITALDELADTGLIEGGSAGRYTMHQVVADYARSQVAPQAMTRLVTYMAQFTTAYHHEYEMLEREIPLLLKTLEAGEIRQQEEIMTIALSYAPFLFSRGLYELAERIYTQVAICATQHNRYDEFLYHRAQLASGLGDFTRAEQIAHEGLLLAQRNDHPHIMRLLQLLLANLAIKHGNIVEAERLHRELLDAARHAADRYVEVRVLTNLIAIMQIQGKMATGQAYANEGLQISRTISDPSFRDYESGFVNTLGLLFGMQGEYDQAEAYVEEGVRLSRELKNPERISIN